MPVDSSEKYLFEGYLSEEQQIKLDLLEEQLGFDLCIKRLRILMTVYRLTGGLIDKLYEQVESEEK